MITVDGPVEWDLPEFLQTVENWGLLHVLEVPASVTGWTHRPKVWETKEQAGTQAMGLRQFPRLAASTPPAKSIEQIAKHSSSMRKQSWETYRIKDTNKGPEVWEVKACAFYQKRGDLPS